MRILLTGCAGFIGGKIGEFLLKDDNRVLGVDNLNDYYQPALKEWRLSSLKKYSNFLFYKGDITDRPFMRDLFQKHRFDAVLNLAARAGTRASLKEPWIYFDTNTGGTLNLLELSREFGIKKFLLASTSSVYGLNRRPFSEESKTDTPLSPYAASKKGAETISYTYHYLYGLDISVVRYFTVYGPAGRPDMSVFRFIKQIDEGIPLSIFGDGSQERDFTFIDDIVGGTLKAIRPLGYEIINLGGDRPVKLSRVINLIENNLEKKARLEYRPRHPADVPATWADINKAKSLLDWRPLVSIEEGIARAVNWYLENRGWLQNIALSE